MNIERLSKRLENVAAYIENGMTVADIGSDHAYLPCFVVKRGIASRAIAGEVANGPFDSASRQVAQAGLQDQIQVRKGDGLDVIKPGEVDCVVIAGMGGALIRDILERGKSKLVGVSRLILQPNLAADQIRKWLILNEWHLADEELVEEDGKIYEILVATKGDPYAAYQHLDLEILVGPYLLQEKSGVFLKKWNHEVKQWEKIVLQLDKAENGDKTVKRREELLNKIAAVKEVLD